jgi:dipeptidyl aminopeptidase/acylaminoacyl peptidase
VASGPSAAPGPELLPSLRERFQDPSWFARPPSALAYGLDGRGLYFERPRADQGGSELRYLELDSGVERAVLPGEGLLRWPEPQPGLQPDQPLLLEHEGDLFVVEAGRAEPRQLTRTRAHERPLAWLPEGRRLAFESNGALFTLALDSGLVEQRFEVRFEADPETKPKPEPELLAAEQLRLIRTLAEREARREASRQREREEARSDPYRASPTFYLEPGWEARQRALATSGRILALLASPTGGEDKRDLMPDYVTDSAFVETRPVRPFIGMERRPGQRLYLLDAVEPRSRAVDWAFLPGLTDNPLAELEAAEAARQAARRAKKDKSLESGDSAPTGSSAANATDSASAQAADALPPVTELALEGAAVEAPPVTSSLESAQNADSAQTADAQDQSPAPPAAPKPRDLSIERLRWSPKEELLGVELRSTDNKDRWLCVIDPQGELELLLEHRRDPAWIGWDFAQWDWLPDGSGLWWLSERSGYSQLYVQRLDESTSRALTPARSEASVPRLSADGRYLYLISNATHPGIHQLARVRLADGAFELLSAPAGQVEEFALSPDGRQVAFVRSYAQRPGEIFIQNASAGAPAKRLTHSTTAAFDGLTPIAPLFVEFPGQGGTLHARLYLPPDGAPDRRQRLPQMLLEGQTTKAVGRSEADTAAGDVHVAGAAGASGTNEAGAWTAGNVSSPAPASPPGAGRPAVLFVHGAGYLQNAHQGWSGYFREFFFHDLLARQGLIVLDLDYRASAGYGRDWRTAVHRQVGAPELEDLAAGVQYLVSHHGVDPARIGVYGGSYGGFLTLLALFKRPGLFACGAALRPVTDWRHYNDGYTRNLMETPALDPEGFAASSPIDHAEGLTRPLLICHGLLDDNVLAKDSIRLAQRLIELGKTDWELALFPLEPHGFREPASWIDEYTRIWLLFQRCLL